MAEDVNASIGIDIDASQAIAAVRQLSAEISAFHQLHSKKGAAVARSLADQTQNLTNLVNRTGSYRASMTTVASATQTFTNALEKNKLSMGENMRYAMGSMKPFSRMFKSEWEMVSKVARERVKDLQTQYIRLGRDANGAVQAIKIRPLTLDMDNLQTKTMLAAQRMQVLNKLVENGSTNLLNWGKNTQWAGRQLMVGFTIPLTMLGAASAKTFMDMEREIIKIQRVYGDFSTTVEETRGMTDALKELSVEFTKWGVSVTDTLNLAAEAAATGAMGADLINQVTNATKLAVLGNVSQTEALETTMSVTNAFGIATEDLAKKIDFLNAVENQSVTSIKDLTVAIPIAAPVVKQLGGSVEDLAFFMTAMKEGGIDAGEGANALKSGLASMINPSEKAAQMLMDLGINLKGIVESNQGDVKSTVLEFASALDTLDPLQRAQAIEQLFGKFQFSRISTLFQNVIQEGTQAQRVLELSRSSTEQLAVLSQRELAKVEDSTTFKFEAAMQRFQASLAPVGEQFLKAVTPLLDFGTSLLEQFNKWDDGAKTFAVTFAAILGGIGPVLLMAIGLVANGVANIIKLFQLFAKSMFGAGKSTGTLGTQTDYLTQNMSEAAAAASSLGQTHSNLTQIYTSETAALKNLAAALETAAASQRKMVSAQPAVGRTRGPKKYMMGTKSVPKYAEGVAMVPGPKGKGDVVPAMLSPGEAIIPTDMAKKYAPLIEGMIAGNIKGFVKGGVVGGTTGRVTGGQFEQRAYSPLAMMAPGNTATGPGIDLDWLKTSEEAKAAWAGALKAGTMFERGVSLSQRNYADFSQELGVVTDELLTIYRTGITDDVTNVAQVGQKTYPQIIAHIDKLEAEGRVTAENATALKVATRKLVAATEQDLTDIGNQRVELGKNEQGKTVVKRVANERSGGRKDAVKRATGIEYLDRGLTQREDVSYAHLTDDSRKMAYVEPKVSARNTPEEQELARKLRNREKLKIGQVIEPSEGSSSASTKKAEERGKKDAKAYSDAKNKVLDKPENDPYVQSTDRNSPHRRAKKDGMDDAKAYNDGKRRTISQSEAYGAMSKSEKTKYTKAVNAGDQKLAAQLLAAKRRELRAAEESAKTAEREAAAAKRSEAARKGVATRRARAEARAALAAEQEARSRTIGGRIGNAARRAGARLKGSVGGGRGAMAGSVASMGLMMGSSMMPEGAGAAGSIVGGVGMGASMGSMLGPQGAAVGAALGLVASSATALKEAFDGAQRSAEAFAKSTGASSQAIKAISEASGMVSAGEVMDKRRETSMQFARTEETNAISEEYLASEAGQASVQALGKSLSSGGSQAAISNIVSQMTTAIATGAVSATDARAIVEDIGTQLGDSSFALKANAEIQNMIGPNGEDLAKDPIGVRIKILEDTQSQLGTITDKVEGFGQDMGQIFTENLMNFDTPLASLNSILNLVSPIALVTNTIIGGVQQMQELGTSTAAFAANVTIAAQQGQEMLDSLQIEYEQRIAVATAAGDLAEATRLQAEYEGGRQKILAQNAETLKSASTAYSEMESNAQTGVIGSIDQQIRDLYKEGPLAAIAEQSISQIGSLTPDGSETEFVLKTVLNTGDVDPETMNSVLALLGEEQIDVAANIITNFGGAEADRIFELSKLVDNPEIRTSLLVGMQGMTPEEAARTLTTFEEIGKVAGQEGIDAIVNLSINDNGELDINKLDEIRNQINGLEAEFNAGPVSAERVRQYIFESTGFNITQDQQDYYNSLPPDQQKTYTTTFLTILKTINEDLNTGQGMIDLQQWATDSGRRDEFMVNYGTGGKIFNYNAAAAAKADEDARQQATPPPSGGGDGADDNDSGTDGGGGGGTPPKSAEEIQIENMNRELSKHQKALTVLSFQEDEINKKYEKRKEALQKIAEINAQISEEQRGQLDLAGSLASGDIAAAARSAQEMRAKAADNAVKDQEKALEDAQKRELAAVTFDGQTRAEREAQIKDFEKKIADLEYRMPPKEESSGGGSGGGGGGGGSRSSTTTTTTTTTPATPPVTTPTTGANAINAIPGASQFMGMTVASTQAANAIGDTYKNLYTNKLPNSLQVLTNKTNTSFTDILKNAGNAADGTKKAWGTSLGGIPGLVNAQAPGVASGFSAFGMSGATQAGSVATSWQTNMAGIPGAVSSQQTAVGEKFKSLGEESSSKYKEGWNLFDEIGKVWESIFGGAASGGLITGPGGPTSDSIPMMLSNGEYVVRASSVSKVGLPFMEAINKGEMPDLKGTKIAVPGIKYNSKGPAINKGESAQEASGSVYNYSIVVNAETNANPDQIASAVMSKIKQVEGQRVRGVTR